LWFVSELGGAECQVGTTAGRTSPQPDGFWIRFWFAKIFQGIWGLLPRAIEPELLSPGELCLVFVRQSRDLLHLFTRGVSCGRIVVNAFANVLVHF
jgi:hypothetical protein